MGYPTGLALLVGLLLLALAGTGLPGLLSAAGVVLKLDFGGGHDGPEDLSPA